MERIKGLSEYVKWEPYRKALGLPGQVEEQYKLLGQGEYNINYSFFHPITGKKLLLRVNGGSQMHLEDQIGYEYRALKVLEGSGRTPKAYYVDGSRQKLNHGVMVMEFLPGKELDYHTELAQAARCLADIHSVPVKKGLLICPKNPLQAILEECESMVQTYMESPLGDEEKKQYIRRMLDAGWRKAKQIPDRSVYQCCVNTELNSTNFLANGQKEKTYLIDWEKPLYADPAQDLGHFLAPTTTFWKTDVILEREQMDEFFDEYIRAVDGRFSVEGLRERVDIFMRITCLRGVTWCAMAWVQYRQPDKLIVNASTAKKLDEYLDMGFLEKLYVTLMG